MLHSPPQRSRSTRYSSLSTSIPAPNIINTPKCVDCQNDAGDDCLACDRCDGWVHCECAKIPAALAQSINGYDRILVFCGQCLTLTRQCRSPASETLDIAESERHHDRDLLMKLQSDMSSLSSAVTATADAVKALSDTRQNFETPITEPIVSSDNACRNQPSYASMASQGAGEGGPVIYTIPVDEDEAKRRRCPVLSALPENGNDFETASNVIRLLDPSATIEQVFRMGLLHPPRRTNSSTQSSHPVYKGIFLRRSMSDEDRRRVAALRAKAYELNQSLASTEGNTYRYVVVNEKLVVFKGCVLEGGRLVRGKYQELDYSFASVNNKFVVTLN